MFIEVESPAREENKRAYALVNVEHIIGVVPVPGSETEVVLMTLGGPVPVRSSYASICERVNEVRPVKFLSRLKANA